MIGIVDGLFRLNRDVAVASTEGGWVLDRVRTLVIFE